MTDVALAQELRLIGRPVARHDARDKVAAATAYAADWAMPGMLHGAVLRSPYPSARIRRLETSRAARLPGVVAVLTAKDVPRNTLWTDVPGQTTTVGPLRARVHVLVEGRVRYQGEPVALVAAESEELARAALEAVEVEYEPLPGVFDPAAALEPQAPRVHEEGNLLAHWRVLTGDVTAALARADIVVEGEYRTQFVDAAYLEPESGVAWIDSDGVITIRVSTQVIEHFRDVAEVLQVPQNRVRVIGTYLGGGFGGKEDVTVEVYLGLLAWRTGRPVKMVWTRQESLLARAKRHPFRMRYRTGATRSGELVAQQIELLADAGAYAYLSALVLLYATVTAAGPYRVPAVEVEARVAYTNNPPTSAMRGFGAMQVVFGYESQMDRVARAVGLDPVRVRQLNSLRRGDTLPVGQVIETHVALPELAARAWAALGEASRPRAPHVSVGRGLACNFQPYGRIVWLHDWSSAWVGFEMDGSVVVRTGVPDVGGGQASSLCQIAAEVLGVDLERVSIHIADSALTPLAGTTTATRQLYMSGNAVLKAAETLRQQILGVAASMLGDDAAALEMADGAVHAPDGRALALPEVLARCARVGVPRSHLDVFHAPAGEPVDLERGSGKVFPDYTFGAHAVEVEVDTETGAVRVLKHVAAHDVGRAINPQSVEGQIQGGAVMGLGYGLMEEVVLEEGVNLTTSFAAYLIPTALDVPDVEPLVVESGEGLGPFGARGIGEPPIGPPAAALANAIEDATGVRVTMLPLTPERVARALGLVSPPPLPGGGAGRGQGPTPTTT
ncbi:MAG: xanthine dehydrogenase family protein molybdopterin-binding subunit [Candidatus Rokubacteria bacterium]|nr:xanthine dehydrogenase family protein molybdopterin-binding subunit [Candidatus Rokubacteria bacterium]